MRCVGSKVTRSNARFTLSDLEDDMSSGLIVVKREKKSLPLSIKKYHIDLTMKNPNSHKRKTSEATDLNLENLGAKEALQKLFSFS